MNYYGFQGRDRSCASRVSLHPFSLLSPLLLLRRRARGDGGGLSSDNAKDIRHLLKMQNIPSEGEKGRDRPRLSVMLRILIAQTSSGFAGTKASDRSRSLDVLRFFFYFLKLSSAHDVKFDRWKRSAFSVTSSRPRCTLTGFT